jgi:hypothetical protein
VRLHREARQAGFSNALLFPAWIGSTVNPTSAKPGSILAFDEGFIQSVEQGWSEWRGGTHTQTTNANTLLSGVDSALMSGLLLGIENSAPPGWSSSRPGRKRGVRWLTPIGFVLALMVAFAGRWNWLGRAIDAEKASLEQLRSVHEARKKASSCSMSDLMEMLQSISQAARWDVTASSVVFSVADGIHLTGVGPSPSRIRSFLESSELYESTISFTARDRDILFQVEAPFSCDH